MKKLSVVLLILVLVAGSVFAAVTPEFSGRFRFGYKFAFSDGTTTISRWKSPAELKLNFEFGTDVWKIAVKGNQLDQLFTVKDGELKGDGFQFGENDKIGANLTFNIDKVADMGDHKLAVSMGANYKTTALTSYNEVTDDYYKFKNLGKTTFEARYGYANVAKVNLAVDPVKSLTGDNTINSFMLSAQGKFADGAVSASAQYAFHPVVYSYTLSRALDIVSNYAGMADFSKENKEMVWKNGFGASVNVDIAKLANLDFMLKFAAYDNFATDGSDREKFNTYGVNVQGGVDQISGFVELAVETFDAKKVTVDEWKGTALDLALAVKIGMVENLPIQVYFQMNDMGDKLGLNSFKVGAEATYKVLALDLNFAKAKSLDKGVFTITPKMVVSF